MFFVSVIGETTIRSDQSVMLQFPDLVKMKTKKVKIKNWIKLGFVINIYIYIYMNWKYKCSIGYIHTII